MSKRSYRSVPVNVARTQLSKFSAQGAARVIVGLDLAKEKQLAAITFDGRNSECVVHFTSPQDNRAFIELVASLGPQVEVALESTGTYGETLMHGLRQVGLRIFQVATKRVHDAQEIFDGVPSLHDAKAAVIIARLHADGLSTAWDAPTAERRALKAASQTLERYQREYMATLGRLEAMLARCWPELTQALALASATLPTLLAQYGGPLAVAAAPQEAFACMRRTAGPGLAVAKIQRVVDTAPHTVGVPLIEAESEALKLLAADAKALRQKREKAKRALARLGQKTGVAKNLAALLGPASASWIVMALGNPSDYASPQALQKACGLNLKHHSSGKKAGQLSIAKRGPGGARHYLFFAALRLVSNNPIVNAWYRRRLERNGGVKLKAVVAVMRKLVRAVWRMARSEDEFDARRLFDTANLSALLAHPMSPSLEAAL